MLSLGFLLEEPEEPYTDLRHCSVFLHEMMPSPMLNGFHVLLRCLSGESSCTVVVQKLSCLPFQCPREGRHTIALIGMAKWSFQVNDLVALAIMKT